MILLSSPEEMDGPEEDEEEVGGADGEEAALPFWSLPITYLFRWSMLEPVDCTRALLSHTL